MPNENKPNGNKPNNKGNQNQGNPQRDENDSNQLDQIMGAITQLANNQTAQAKINAENARTIDDKLTLLTARVAETEERIKQRPDPAATQAREIIHEAGLPAPEIDCAVELIDPRGRQIAIPSLREIRLRSRYDIHQISKRERGTRTIGEKASQTPVIPGINVRIIWNSEECKCIISDPLCDDEACRHELARALEGMPAAQPDGFNGKITGVPTRERELNRHEAKSLCRDLAHFLRIERARIVAGALPSFQDCDRLPGRYLFDPFSESHSQPRFSDQMESYYTMVNSQSIGR